MTEIDEAPVANAERGEVPLQIGSVHMLICVGFGPLARLSKAIGAETMDEVYRRLLGAEPLAMSCAIRCFSVHPDGVEEARALADRALGEVSAADEPAFREAIGAALTAHVAAGRKRRGEPEPDLADTVEAALDAGAAPGKPAAATD